jgi:RNA polymerase sigma-70 factor (ECF subfamily)
MAAVLKPETWVDFYGDMLFSYALVRLRDRSAAEDLVQDTFLTGISTRDSFQGRATEKTWLFGILKHKIADHIRKKYQGMNKITDRCDVTEAFFDERGNWKVPPREWPRTPLSTLEDRRLQRQITHCLKDLAPTHRDLYTFRGVHGYSAEECCSLFGLSATHLGVILHRVRLSLRRCLEKNWFQRSMP